MPQLMKTIKDTSTGVKPTAGIDPLLPALLQFLMQGYQRAGQMAGDASNRYSSAVERVASGKPMNAPGEASQIGGLANPIAGVIKPGTWQAMTPEAKSMMTTIADKFPDFFKRILEYPTSTVASVSKQAPGLAGTQTTHTVNPQMAFRAGVPWEAGKPTASVINVDPKYAADLVTPLHELQHALNFSRVAKSDPADASTIGLLLHELLPKTEQGSLNKRMGQYQDVMAPQISAPMGEALQQVQHYGENAFRPTPSGYAPAGGGQGYYKAGENLNEFYQRAMMDEGLAYLAEQTVHAAPPPGMFLPALNAAPKQELQGLANQLGVGTSTPIPFQPPAPRPGMDFQNLSMDEFLNKHAAPAEGQGQVGGQTGGEVDWQALLNSLGFGQ